MKQHFYDEYIESGQAGVNPQAASDHARYKLAKGHPYLTRLIKRFFPVDREARVLDLGCGHGTLLAMLKKAGYPNIGGVDTSPAQVRLAHEMGLKEVELGNAIDFLDSQSPANVVCCFDLFEHLTTEECHALASKIYGILVADGLLIVHVPNGEGLFGQRIRYGDLTHETCFTPKSMTQLLCPIGFHSVCCFEDKPIPHGFLSLMRLILWEFGTVWPRLLLASETGDTSFILSQNMLVVARKSCRQ